MMSQVAMFYPGGILNDGSSSMFYLWCVRGMGWAGKVSQESGGWYVLNPGGG